MRLGIYPAKLAEDTIARRLYDEEVVYERHRHRWEVNNRYRQQLQDAGLVLSGMSPDGRLVEFIELSDHPYFIATQAHPELKSRPNHPHPLFDGLVAAARVPHERAGEVATEPAVAKQQR
jgi:CTP synthase